MLNLLILYIILVFIVFSVMLYMCSCLLVGVGFFILILYVFVLFIINVILMLIVFWLFWWIVEENGDRFRVGFLGCKEKIMEILLLYNR